MPIQEGQDMATKCKRKWMMLHQKKERESLVLTDDSLTSLQWLQGFTLTGSDSENLNSFGDHSHPLQTTQAKGTRSSPTAKEDVPHTEGSGVELWSNAARPCSDSLTLRHRDPNRGPVGTVDYKTNAYVKPPYSYVSLICMAMNASENAKLPISDIYKWITDNFCYFRHADPSWHNSIRHNLSFNKCFMKVPRDRNDPGKGGLWRMNPQYADMFVNGVFKRKRSIPQYSVYSQAQQMSQKDNEQQLAPVLQVDNDDLSMKFLNKGSKRRRNNLHWTQKSNPLLGQEPQGLPPSAWLSDVHDDDKQCQWAFDDLELSAALHSLGKEMDELPQTWHATSDGNLSVVSQESGPKFSEVNQVCPEGLVVPADSLGSQQLQIQGIQLSLTPSQYFEELTLVSDQQTHPWDSLKEDMVAVPVTLENGLSVCEGFLYDVDVQAWDRMEAYLHV